MIEYGVVLMQQHYAFSEIKCGNKLHIGRLADIDYTGGLYLGNNVNILEGVKILTHGHDTFDNYNGPLIPYSNKAYRTPLVIEDNVLIGARACILPGVKIIRRGAVVFAGSVVTKAIPPYALVCGNPAKVIGFRYTPRDIIECEQRIYPEKERIPIDELNKNYEKYFLKKIKEIKEFTKL